MEKKITENKPVVLQSKKLLYVQIYDDLYKRIMNHEFPEGSFLPSEPKLAELLDISRVTVRQALSLLQEDGLIKSIHGRGNMVTRPVQHAPDGLEKIAHPIYLCCDQMPDDVEMDSRLELPSNYLKSVFGQKATAIMVADRWYKHKGELIAFTVSFIPVEAAGKLNIDLADQEALLSRLEEGIYEMAVSSAIEVKIALTSSFITNRYELPENGAAQLISESLYFGENHPYIHNKHYLITPDHQIRINGVK